MLDDTGLSRTHLSELANGEGLQHEVTARLLGSMRKHTKPVLPAVEHHWQRPPRPAIRGHGCEMASFQYKKILDVDDDGLPVVIETAFGWKGEFSADRAGSSLGLVVARDCQSVSDAGQVLWRRPGSAALREVRRSE